MKYILVILVMFLSSCNTPFCVTVGGEYEGIKGNITYCYNAEQTKIVGNPVFTSADGKVMVGITEQELEEVQAGIDKKEVKEKTKLQKILEKIKK